MPSHGNIYLTPKRSIIRIDDVPACPPPPRAPSKLVGDRVLNLDLQQDRLSDTLLGFFLAAPCNSSGSIITTDRNAKIKNNRIKLLPKKSSISSNKYNDHVRLKPKGKLIDQAAGAATAAATYKFEATNRGRTARSA